MAVACCAIAGCGRSQSSNRSRSDSAALPVRSADSSDSAGPTDSAGTANLQSAVSILQGYYDAIDHKNYSAAFAAWGDSGPPGRPTESQFAHGYARTDSVRLSVGTPGRIEGAAGSRYVDIPVTVRAFGSDGETVYTGSYTLRRVVVSGASTAERRWHLYRATLVPPGLRAR